MKKGGKSSGDSAAGGRRGTGRAFAVGVAVLLGGLLVFTVCGCGQDEGAPTSDLSTVSTGAVPSVTTTSGGVTGTSGSDSTDDTQIAPEGTHLDPIPLAQKARVGDWEVRVVAATLDATQVVLDENMFNDSPDSGSRYVMIALAATYVGQGSSTFWIDMLYTFVGGEGDTFGVAPAVAPDSITNDGEVTNGGSVSGSLVFLVDSEQVSGGTLMLEEAFAWDVGRIFFAVE